MADLEGPGKIGRTAFRDRLRHENVMGVADIFTKLIKPSVILDAKILIDVAYLEN